MVSVFYDRAQCVFNSHTAPSVNRSYAINNAALVLFVSIAIVETPKVGQTNFYSYSLWIVNQELTAAALSSPVVGTTRPH